MTKSGRGSGDDALCAPALAGSEMTRTHVCKRAPARRMSRPTGGLLFILPAIARVIWSVRFETRLREKSNFTSRFKLIWVVQMLAQKYSAFVFSEIHD